VDAQAWLLLTLSVASLGAWVHLCFGHGRFWRADQRLPPEPARGDAWPEVTAVVPARNESDVVERSVSSLLEQDYPGQLRVVLVDDESEDATAERARAAAANSRNGARLHGVRTGPRPPGWVGKMWAVHTGVSLTNDRFPDAEYLWLTDADVVHHPRTLRRLVAHARTGGFDLVSLMVRLHCRRGWERLLVPAFVYFFQQLYPFPRVNDPAARTAAAAGGCVLVRRDALARAGGIEAIRDEVIDDCALGRAIKRSGRIWLGLADFEHSVRPYAGLSDIWDMVARSAYTQLGHSPLALLGTLLGLLLLYAVPVLVPLSWPLHQQTPAALLAGAAWLLLAVSFRPTLRLYRRSPALAPALPLAGVLYAAMTFDSALRHHRGEGARWKGRTQAGRGQPSSA
jgi:hopene-associated glycosyltransferase HpnB